MFNIDTSDRGVSPVVGVILMVAVTVILAAVIGTFVLDLGNNVQDNPQAGVTFDEDSDFVSAQTISMGNADEVYLQYEDPDGNEATADISGVGESADLEKGVDIAADSDVTAVGVLDGKETVLQTYER